MEQTISATELARGLSDILSRVKYRGERFVIERNGEPVASLGPAPPKGITLRELYERLDKFGPVDDQWADDLEAIHAAQGLPRMPEWPD